ncbi:hypothetical protein [Microvirga sp. VF16]|uniref:hypothetical protein n=1 Tax=Microvirga sp. VF16 TaxID=2807101 RepID=UPI00193E64EF|nr:hypothetical protein [Microvirga sp. VF16]QRM35244.1 hypothetical protein JO965_40445 [Microvirga sp. VF16]
MKISILVAAAWVTVVSGSYDHALAQTANNPPVSQGGDSQVYESPGESRMPPGTLHQSPLDDELPKLLPRSDLMRAVDAYKRAVAELKRSLDVEFSGNPDADFMRLLIAQYEGMVALGSVMLDYGSDPKLRETAEYAVDIATQELANLRELQTKPKP